MMTALYLLYHLLQALAHVTNECLQSAHQYKSLSISFPALGTGNVGLSKVDASKVMTETVLNFATANQRQLDVYFVIHPHDKDTYKVRQPLSLKGNSTQGENHLYADRLTG